jgi:hypothetical protein
VLPFFSHAPSPLVILTEERLLQFQLRQHNNGVRDGSKDTDSRIKQNRTDLMRRLHKAGVKAELWPSA